MSPNKKKRVIKAIRYMEKMCKDMGLGEINKWWLVSGDKEIFGIAPDSIVTKSTGIINISNIIPFYWKGKSLLAL